MTCCYIPNWKRKEWKPKPKYRIYENKHGKFYIKTRGFFGWKVLRQTEGEYDILSRPGIQYFDTLKKAEKQIEIMEHVETKDIDKDKIIKEL